MYPSSYMILQWWGIEEKKVIESRGETQRNKNNSYQDREGLSAFIGNASPCLHPQLFQRAFLWKGYIWCDFYTYVCTNVDPRNGRKLLESSRPLAEYFFTLGRLGYQRTRFAIASALLIAIARWPVRSQKSNEPTVFCAIFAKFLQNNYFQRASKY